MKFIDAIRSTMVTALVVLVCGYVLLGLLLFVFQRHMLYLPTARIPHQFEQRVIENQGEKIVVIVVNPGKDQAALYFGGNAEAVVASGAELEQTLTGHTIYLVNYRGYGGSTGSPSEKALYDDALRVFDTVAGGHLAVSVIGRSLGSGIATYLARERDIARLVLITPFDSVRSVAQSLYPIFPAGLILLDEYDSLARVSQISAPTLILMAEQDNVIPNRFSMKLASAFPRSQLSTRVIPGTGHNTISARTEYHEAIQAFLADGVEFPGVPQRSIQ